MDKYSLSNASWMSRRLLAFGVIAVIVMTSLSQLSFGEESRPLCASCVRIPSYELEMYKSTFPLIIWTDDPTYDHSSTIALNGHVKPQNVIAPVTITIRNPIGNVVHVQQVTPDNEGNFVVLLETSSQLWKQDGEYAILAQSGTTTRSFKTSVELVPYDVSNTGVPDNVVPEFGPLSALILIVGVGSTVLLSRKSFTSFVTKV